MMSIELQNIQNNPNIGVFILVTNTFALVPSGLPEHFLDKLKVNLKVELFEITTFSRIIGVLGVANSNGILLSSLASKDDVKYLADTTGLEVQHLTNRFFALGNIIIVNDHAAVCAPLLDNQSKEIVESVLNIPIESYRFGFSDLVGSLTVSTNIGCLVSPEATDEEVAKIGELLKVKKAKIGTLNRGQTFISAGIIANRHGALCGEETTGLEIMRISETLFEST